MLKEVNQNKISTMRHKTIYLDFMYDLLFIGEYLRLKVIFSPYFIIRRYRAITKMLQLEVSLFYKRITKHLLVIFILISLFFIYFIHNSYSHITLMIQKVLY